MPPTRSRAIPCRTLPLRDFLAAIPAFFLAAGCGGSTTSIAGTPGPDGSTPFDASAPAPLDCSTAAEGAPCENEGAICRDTCAPCAICSFLGCGGGRWSLGSDVPPESCFVDSSAPDAEAHDANAPDAGIPASTVPCGLSLDGGVRLCAFPLEYCEESGGGPPPPPDAGPFISYACVKFPAACASSPTCACLEANAASLCGAGAGALMCTTADGGTFAPTVTCAYP